MMEWLDKNPDASSDKVNEKEDEFNEKLEKEIKNKNARRDALFDTNNIRNRLNDNNDELGELSSNDKKKKYKMLFKSLKIG